jgi:hypothetical protein
MLAGRRERKHDEDRPAAEGNRRFQQCLALGMQLAKDFLEAADPRFDLDQDGLGPAVEAQVDRSPTRTRDGRLDRRAPAPIATPQDSLDDSSLGGVANERTRPIERRQPKIRAEDRSHPKPNSERNFWIALLEPADH